MPYYEFNAWKLKFAAALVGNGGEAKEDPETSKRQATEDLETDKPSKRQKTADEEVVSSSSSHQSSMLDYFTTTVVSITVGSSP